MELQRFILGELAVNSYLLWDERTKEAVCIDPGAPAEEILAAVKKNSLSLTKIVLTHGHVDHILGVEEVKASTGTVVLIHSADAPMLSNPLLNLSQHFGKELLVYPDSLLADGDVICAGGVILKVRHTPGHTPGGISLLGPAMIFCGDLVFAGSIGRTDFPGGDREKLLKSAVELLKLPGNTRILPGHGPETTVGRERLKNPFLSVVTGKK